MAWQEEFIGWCKEQRDLSAERADWLETGRMTMHINHEDVSADTAARERANVAKLSELITHVEKDIGRSQAS